MLIFLYRAAAQFVSKIIKLTVESRIQLPFCSGDVALSKLSSDLTVSCVHTVTRYVKPEIDHPAASTLARRRYY